MRCSLPLLFTIVCLSTALAQPDAPPNSQDLQFEVASVKMSPPNAARRPGGGGGPGTTDPGRIRYPGSTLKSLIAIAYGMDFDRIHGAQWTGVDRYAIEAKVPAGATKEQTLVMLQHLLRDRFHLVVHTETDNFPAYEIILAKGGPKLRESEGPGPPPAIYDPDKPTPVRFVKDGDGFPIVPPGHTFMAGFDHGVERAAGRNITMEEFANVLQWDLAPIIGDGFSRTVIVDRTGLTGKYDFHLEFRQRMDQADVDSPDIFTAMQKQLGLRLQKTDRVPLPVLMIDQADRTPTEN